MDYQEENTKWFSVFKKAVDANSQIAFSRKLTVSVIDASTNVPLSEMIDMKLLVEYEGEWTNNAGLTCFVDNRTYFYDSLVSNDVVNFSVYFPLSKEKFVFTGTRVIVSNKTRTKAAIRNKLYVENLNKIMTSLLKQESNCKNETQNIETVNNYCDSISNKIVANDKIIKDYWDSLNNEEKLSFEAISPETIKLDAFKEKVKDDLVKFEAQEEILPNDNFSVLFLIPFEVDYTIYPMPQVIANSRKPNFESLYKPQKKTRRFYFFFNFLCLKWLVKELNP